MSNVVHYRMHETTGTGVGRGRSWALWGWLGDGSQMDGDWVGTVVRCIEMQWGRKKYWGWGRNGAVFHYRVMYSLIHNFVRQMTAQMKRLKQKKLTNKTLTSFTELSKVTSIISY